MRLQILARFTPFLMGILFSAGVPWTGGTAPLSAQTGGAADDPRGGWAEGSFFLESRDGRFRMTLGGRIQPRYQLRWPVEGETTSSFFLRRVRLDVQGHVLDDRLTFRFMPELARTANLRDGWVDYAVRPALRLRAGQQVAPFHWHRFVSGNRQHFAERSLPSETFGFPNGYDVGVVIHGRDPSNRLAYGVGLFDGAGRNVAESNSAGNLASGRVTWAVRGTLPREEPDLGHSEVVQVTLGLGLQGATRSEIRGWDLGRSVPGNRRADWATGTVDVSVRWKGFSTYGEGYLRNVSPDDPAVSSYSGRAHGFGVGYFLLPGRLEAVGRWSELRLDRRVPGTRERQWGVGLNTYHHGHLWKTHFQYLQGDVPGGKDHILLLQAHLQF